jgi:hypothetical protein
MVQAVASSTTVDGTAQQDTCLLRAKILHVSLKNKNKKKSKRKSNNPRRKAQGPW